jgi:hypothetical protein
MVKKIPTALGLIQDRAVGAGTEQALVYGKW